MNILLTSKYSQHCQKLLEFLKGNNLIQALNLNIICIDNENVRKRIKNAEIEIKNVPCLLSIVDNIKVEKFEGNELNKWISFHFEQIMNQQQQMMMQQQQQMMMQQQQQQQMMQQQQQGQPPVIPQPQKMMKQPLAVIPEENDNEDGDVNLSMEKFAQSQMQAQQQLKIEQLHKKPSQIPDGNMPSSASTSIDDLLGEEEDEKIEELSHASVQEIVGKKAKKKYTSAVNDYNEYETKNKKKDQKKLDLLNAAMLMKKSREDEDKSIKSFS